MNGRMGEITIDASLEKLLGHLGTQPADVASVTRTPSRFATLFPADVVTIALRSGDRLSVFVKRLGSEQADHPDKRCRDREVRVYEELLREAGLPVPRFYGWEWDAENGRQELFLEHVDDWDLRYQQLEYWLAAARALARLHGWFAERRDLLGSLPFLLRIDEVYVRAWAIRAVDAVGSISPPLGTRLQRAVKGIGPAAALLARMPPTLLHNDLSPKNVIADRSVSPARICFVDWELAGFGCGPLDLVHLRYGLEPADASRLWSAYCAELAGADVLPRDGEEEAVLAACELHKTLYRLAHVHQWRLPATRIEEWVTEVERLLSALRGLSARPEGARA
jgi:aminoglycoside phosphotransferase (APT) family kinase protein